MAKKQSESMTNNSEPESFEDKKQRLETPDSVYYLACKIAKGIGIYPPELDLMASNSNTKCIHFIDREMDIFKTKPLIWDKEVPKTCWINAPHRDYEKVVPLLHNHWETYGFTIIALMPSNTERTDYFHKYIEKYRLDLNPDGHIFYIPINMRIPFNLDGKQATDAKGRKDVARDAYKLVFWIGNVHLKGFMTKVQEYFTENEGA